jgi:pyruvate dehydrogenase E2 component (dihydrolipoamide acetyltransferase)
MIKDVVIPDIGEKIESGDVVSVLVKKGDTVTADDPILEFETDKAVVEIPAPDTGRIVEVLVESGQTVEVGAVIARIETDAEASAEPDDSGPSQEQAPVKETAEIEEAPEPGAEPVRTSANFDKVEDTPPIGDTAPASPSVRRTARELGVNIDDVVGSGPGGRITVEDVKAHARRLVSGGVSGSAAPRQAVSLPDFSRWGEIERERMSKVRSLTADSMAAAWSLVPHVTQFDMADITDVEAFRKKYARPVESAGGKLTVTAVLLKVLAGALQKFPKFNASIDPQAGEIIYKKYCNIGMAVDTERGLLVPAIRDVDKKSIKDLAIELTSLAQRTRDKKISPDELDGGTFTVSNQGSIGGVNFTPIVYWPQVAILGVSRSSTQPVYLDGELRPRIILPLSLSYDHRIIDGAEAARFLDWVARSLEQPFIMSFE